MGATRRAGSAYPAGSHDNTHRFWWGPLCLVFRAFFKGRMRIVGVSKKSLSLWMVFFQNIFI